MMYTNSNMAALMRHGLTSCIDIMKINRPEVNMLISRCYAKKVKLAKAKIKTVSMGKTKLESIQVSVASKGFLRTQKPYVPPTDASTKVLSICKSVLKINDFPDSSFEIKGVDVKFRILSACVEEFQHAIPSAQLHEIQYIGDLIKFYDTPVTTVTPLDAMKTMNLPENLHVIYDYHRFHPDTDTKFGGITAFPNSSTFICGLRYKKKYKGHITEVPWPHKSD